MPILQRWMPPVVFAMLFAVALPAHADLPRFEVAPFGGYRIGGDFDVEDEDGFDLGSADLEEDFSWGLGLALYRDRNSYYELLFARQNTEFEDPGPALDDVDIKTDYYHFGGTIIFEYEPWLRPYFSLTLGLTRFDADGFGTEYKFSGSIGLGWRLPVNEHLAFIVGARGYGTLVESDTEFFCESGGGRGTCLVQTSGDVFFQGEALMGVAFRF